MVLELISTVGSATKVTCKVVSLTRGISGTSGDVIFRRTDLTAVQSSLEGLSSTFRNERDSLDRATQRKLVNTLLPPVENWERVAHKMAGLLERYETRKAKGQDLRPAVFWKLHSNEVKELRSKSEECKVSLLLAITAAAASVEATHFRTLYSGLCGTHNQLQANHEESRIWMRGLYGSIEGKHEESRSWMRELNGSVEGKHRQSRSWMQDSNRSRMENHDEAMKATGEIGKKVHELVVAVVVAETITLVAIGVWWYFWRGSVEGKHEEARGWMQDSNRSRMKNHHEARSWMQDASRSRMKNHDETMKATMEVGKKVDELVTGLMVTGMATLAAMAATGLWWYFWGRKVDEKKEVVMSKNKERLLSSKNEDVQDASKREKPALKPKPKPELKPKPKSEARMQRPVLAIDRDPIQAAPVAPATNNIRPSTAIELIEEDTTNTTTNTAHITTTTRQGKDCAKKEEQFADVMTQLKIQLDKKARAEAGVDIGVGVGA